MTPQGKYNSNTMTTEGRLNTGFETQGDPINRELKDEQLRVRED